jgi:hypothetical protein
MKVTFVQGIVVATNALRQILLHFQIAVDNECTFWLDKFCIVAETFKIGILGAVYV